MASTSASIETAVAEEFEPVSEDMLDAGECAVCGSCSRLFVHVMSK